MEWLIAVPILLALAGGYVYMGHLDRKRREGIASLAKELGLELNWQLPDAELARFNRFEIANRGRLPTSGTTIIADDGETRMVIFDYSYTQGTHKRKRTYLFSIAMCSNSTLQLPKMNIQTETWQSKMAAFVGYTDIDIPDDPEFSKRFAISGVDPDAIRAFVNPKRRALISKFPNQTLATQDDCVLVIRKSSQLNAENIRELMTEALQITHALLG